jgi:hypothetical protein
MLAQPVGLRGRGRAAMFGFVLVLAALALMPLVLFHTTRFDDDRQPPARRAPQRDRGAGGRASAAAQGGVAPARDRDPIPNSHLASLPTLPSLGAADRYSLGARAPRAEMIGAGSTAAARHQQTNRTPLTHADEPLREPPVADLHGMGNASANGIAGGVFSDRAEKSAQGGPSRASGPVRPLPVSVTPASHAAADTAGCGQIMEQHSPMTPWDEPEATSATGEACSLHSDSLNTVFRQRFEFPPGTLKVGGGYDSQHCYTYAGGDCWVASERSETSPCAAPSMGPSSILAVDDAFPAAVDGAPGRHEVMWQLRRALNLGRISAPDDSDSGGSASADDSDDFGGSFGSLRFAGGGFPSGPWGRRALDVAVDLAASAEWETLSILLHGDGLGEVAEDAARELPAALVMFSAATPAALDQFVARSEALAQRVGLAALDALAPEKVRQKSPEPAKRAL